MSLYDWYKHGVAHGVGAVAMRVAGCLTLPRHMLRYFYDPQTKLREGNVFTGVCAHWEGMEGVCLQ